MTTTTHEPAPACPLCQEKIKALEAENDRLRAELAEREGDIAWCDRELLAVYCPSALPDWKQAG